MTLSLRLKKTLSNRFYQCVAAVIANLGIVCSEMHYGWPSPYMPVLKHGNYTFRVSGEEASWLTVVPLIGAMFGAFGTGMIVDIIGRKRLIILSSLPFIASWLMVALARSSALMFFGRFLAGAADGLSFTAVPMYLGEIADPKIRGLLASACPVCIVLGILLVNVFGALMPIDTAAYVAVAIPVVLLMTFPFMPESPYFYLMKNNEQQARKSLQIFRGTEDISVELERMSKAVKEQNEKKGSFMDLFTVKSNRKALFITLGLRGIQQLSGTTAIIFYCKTIFAESEGFLSPNVGTTVYFGVQLVLSAVSSLVVDFSGRRPLLIISITGSALALLVNGTFFAVKTIAEIDTSSCEFVPIVALLCFVVVFSIGLQNIPLLIMGEIFPTDVKAFALCIMDIYYSIIVTLISKFFDWTMTSYGMHVPFFTFTGCCFLGLIFVILYVPETKGKTLEDIQIELRGYIEPAAMVQVEDGCFY